MPVYSLDGVSPTFPADGSHWIAPGAQVIGNVTLAEEVSIWFNSVLRGDNEPITIGRGSNVQDGAVFHVDPGFPLIIGEQVTVGHMALLHGCTIGDDTLIGMGAMVMNGAKIGKGCVIGANALVTEGKEIPDGSMVLGAPGKIVKTLDAETQKTLMRGAEAYKKRQKQYRKGLQQL